MSASRHLPNGLEGRHVLLAMLAFFGVVFAVNGVFLYSALSTHTGVVAQEPYRKGLHYNYRIAEGQRQDSLEWRDDLQLAPSGALTLSLRDRSGAPVSGLELTGTLGRPATVRQDLRLALVETEAGRYGIAVGPLAAGAWIVSLEASEGASRTVVFRMRKRLWLNP
jgi:nitrogen fixation protein FixH